MKVQKRLICLLTGAAGVLSAAAPTLAASTGNFSSPLTGSNVILSVDINGGIIASNNTSTEGTNGPSASPTLSADPYGVTWSPWGGPTSTSGDGTQLPNNQGGGVTATSIAKTFGGVTTTLSEGGTAASYTTYSGVESLTGRDRGAPSGAAGDGDLFRDFEFAAGSGSNVQSTNFLQLSFSGLASSTSYQVALFSYDSTGSHSMNWSATAPTSQLGVIGYFASGTNTFTAPADEQTITWTAGTTPAPAVFTVTSSASGVLNLYGFGGNGVTGNVNADSSYLNGFQIAAVPAATPEPSEMVSLLGGAFALGGLALRARRRAVRA